MRSAIVTLKNAMTAGFIGTGKTVGDELCVVANGEQKMGARNGNLD
jgi:hypothetical protein